MKGEIISNALLKDVFEPSVMIKAGNRRYRIENVDENTCKVFRENPKGDKASACDTVPITTITRLQADRFRGASGRIFSYASSAVWDAITQDMPFGDTDQAPLAPATNEEGFAECKKAIKQLLKKGYDWDQIKALLAG